MAQAGPPPAVLRIELAALTLGDGIDHQHHESLQGKALSEALVERSSLAALEVAAQSEHGRALLALAGARGQVEIAGDQEARPALEDHLLQLVSPI